MEHCALSVVYPNLRDDAILHGLFEPLDAADSEMVGGADRKHFCDNLCDTDVGDLDTDAAACGERLVH